MNTFKKICFVWAAFIILCGVIAIGCATPNQRAQIIFNKGEYQQVVEKYPGTAAADRAAQILGIETVKEDGTIITYQDQYVDTLKVRIILELLERDFYTIEEASTTADKIILMSTKRKIE
jgi:hypothetical protein